MSRSKVATLSESVRSFYRGQRDSRRGLPCPPCPVNDDDPCDNWWVGWRYAFAKQEMERIRVRRLCGVEDEDDPL